MSEAIAGISVAQYAGIVAAIADELPLDAALANEGIEPAAWRSIDASWKEAIAGDGAGGPLFSAFTDKRAEAEDWLARSVSPLDDDLAAWMRFLAAYGKHPAPFEFLERSGLRLSDLGRLQRKWARRFAESPELEKRAAEIAKQPPKPLPPIAVGSLELKPFPWSRGAAPAAPAPAAEAEAAAALGEMEMPLDRYAALCVELEAPKVDRARVIAGHGLTPERFAAVDASWKERLAADAALLRDFRQLHAYQRSRLAAAAKFVPRDPNAPPPALTGTALSLDRPAGMVLPFAEGEAPVTMGPRAAPNPAPLGAAPVTMGPRAAPNPAPLGAAPPEIAASTGAPKPKPASHLAGTALVLDVPRGPALPFAGERGAAPPVVITEAAPKPAKLSLQGTVLALDTPAAPALPFVEGDAPPEIAAPSGEAEPKPATSRGGTALVVEAPRGPALPFAGDAEPAAAKPAAALPSLTIQQYASLCVELETGVEAEVLARYRISPEERAALDEDFSRRFKQAPAQKRTWERACETYRAWLAAQGR
jgi:hypothetical protein